MTLIALRCIVRTVAHSVVAIVLPSLATASSPAVDPPFDIWSHRLNGAYGKGEDSCDFTPFLDAVEYCAASGDPDAQARVLDWLETFDQRLSLSDARVAYGSILSKVAEPRLRDRATQLVGLLELRSADLSVRKNIYLAAAAMRLWHMPNGSPISDTSALEEAAYDGIAEVRPWLQRITETSNGPWRQVRLSQSAEILLWYLNLRSGALNREDARRVHLERLLAMDVKEFHEGMIGNPAFLLATIRTIDDTCYRARSRYCGLAAALYDRWEAYIHQLPDSEEIEIVPLGPVAQPLRVGKILANGRRSIAGVSW